MSNARHTFLVLVNATSPEGHARACEVRKTTSEAKADRWLEASIKACDEATKDFDTAICGEEWWFGLMELDEHKTIVREWFKSVKVGDMGIQTNTERRWGDYIRKLALTQVL